MAKLGFLGPRLVALLAMLAALVLAHASAAQVSTPSAAPPGDAGPATGRDRGAPSILIIGSFDRSAQSTRMQENAIRDVLDDSFPEARIRSEYLATVRGDGESNQAEVMDLLLQALRVKIGGERFDLLIIIDTLAFEALSGPGRDIIADLPVVFSGLTWDVERLAEANLNATGVFERIDVAGTVDLITTLLPSTRRVLAVSRGSPTADRFRRVAGEQLSARTGGPEIVWSEAPSIPALGREAAGLSPDSAFLFITFRDDTLGARAPYKESEGWPVPVFAVFQSNIRSGMVGGRAVDAAGQGRLAGGLAVRVLRGARPDSIPPLVDSSNRTVLNGPALQRWGIPASRVPAGAEILDPVPPWFDPIRRNWGWIALGCAVQFGVIALLIVSRSGRRRLADELHKSRERYELAIRGTNDGIWDWDIADDTNYWSPRLEELLGYASGELNREGLRWADRLHPEDRDRALAALRAHLGTDEPYDEEYRLRLKNGSYRWFRARGSVVRDRAGRAVRMAGSLSDVHDRVVANLQLHESEERYRQTFHTNQAVKFVLDATDGRIVEANEAASAFYGYPRDRLQTMSIFDINARPRGEISDRIAEAASGRTFFDTRHRLASGELRDVEVYTGPYEFQGRRLLFSIIHDVTHAKRAQRALAESEAKYRRIVETAAEGIWVADEAWRTTFVNARMGEMLGYPPAEMIGKHLFEFMDERARAECERNMARREEGIAEQHEFRFRHKDGRDVWTTMSTNAMQDETGRFTGALAMVTDVTHRRGAETAAREAEAMFRSTFEHAAVGMSNMSLDGRWLLVNDTMCRMLGRDRATLMGMTFADVTHPDDLGLNLRLLRSALAGGGDTYSMEKRYLRPDGSIVWGLITASLARDTHGRPKHFISVIQDISDRKRAEADLHESRRVLEQAQAVGRIGSWTFDPRKDDSLEWSDEVFRIFGTDRAAFPGTADAFFQTVHPDDREMVVEAVRAALAGEREYSIDHRIVRPDGAVRWVHEQAEIERDAEGSAVRMIGVVQDITERTEAQRFGDKQRAVLEMMASGAPLDRTIGAVVRLVEDEDGSPVIGSVLRVDEAGRMWTVGAPHLPAAFSAKIDGLAIGPGVGSCGTAMAEKRRVVVEDIATDPLWAPFRDEALSHGLRACWSEPIPASDGSVLGSLAMYFREVRRPTQREITILSTAAHLAGIAMERERVATELEQSERRNTLAMTAGNMGTFDWDIATGRIIWSEEHARLWGMTLSEFDGTYESFARRVHPDDLPRIAAGIEGSMRSRAAYQAEYRVRHADGAARWVLARGAFDYDPKGRAIRMRGVVVDITDRKAAEEARDRSESAYRALLEAIPDIMFRVDRAGTYLDYHAPDPSRLLVPPEKFMGRTIREVLPKNRADHFMGAVEALFRTGRSQTYEYEVGRTDGASSWWEVRVVLARQDEALLLLRDVTERRESERRERDSQQRLRLLVQGTPLGVISWNLDFTVASWNPGAQRLFGYSEAEALGRDGRFIVPESARGGVDAVWRELVANRGGFRSTNQNVCKNGTLVYCDWYNAPLVDSTGRVIGVASLIEDVTERRMAQQHTDFMMAELDHRVKNNLAAVISLAEQTGRGSGGYAEFLHTFTGRLRAMARMHTVLARSRWQGADLRTLVTQTLEAFGSGSYGRAAVSGPAAMLGPKTAQSIAMALNELATNAVKYGALSSAQGRVEVEWSIDPALDGAPRLKLRWRERGGPPVFPPSRRGFGSELIEGAIAYELRGEALLAFHPEGVECLIDVPLMSESDAHVRDEGGIEFGTRPVSP